jgi:uncharacterized protein YrrD
MSDGFKAADGRKVVSRASAEELGNITHLVLDTERRSVAHVIIGKRKDARIFDWDSVSGFGADAVIVSGEEALREPVNDFERELAKGKLDPVGRRVLSDLGNELGRVDDIIFDSASGVVEQIIVAGQEFQGDALLGAGSYAVVLRVV